MHFRHHNQSVYSEWYPDTSSVFCFSVVQPSICPSTVDQGQVQFLHSPHGGCMSRRSAAVQRVAALDEELALRERQMTEQLRSAQAASLAQLGDVEVRPQYLTTALP